MKTFHQRRLKNALVIKLALLAFALSLAAWGCTMVAYSGPRLPSEQVAYISPHRYLFHKRPCVDEINGLKFKLIYDYYEVAAGPQEIHMSVSDGVCYWGCLIGSDIFGVDHYDLFGPVILRFNAAAGRTYRIGIGELKTGGWEVWIEDGDTILVKEKTASKPYSSSGSMCAVREKNSRAN